MIKKIKITKKYLKSFFHKRVYKKYGSFNTLQKILDSGLLKNRLSILPKELPLLFPPGFFSHINNDSECTWIDYTD